MSAGQSFLSFVTDAFPMIVLLGGLYYLMRPSGWMGRIARAQAERLEFQVTEMKRYNALSEELLRDIQDRLARVETALNKTA